eukprot:CAMPEP_0117673516 /NCGR_PEP_ID=MMETSP0804-20121206/14516_1 /TAXON_ID=1074897 /ORGANISM="Tetraselmis astigmatica, Strain CCMP880" /LENGTH=285 /DNA_ID=CAMNT_0005482263 /DNA_START=44 /DNA_END=901 /DNA_ORIENTATION=+
MSATMFSHMRRELLRASAVLRTSAGARSCSTVATFAPTAAEGSLTAEQFSLMRLGTTLGLGFAAVGAATTGSSSASCTSAVLEAPTTKSPSKASTASAKVDTKTTIVFVLGGPGSGKGTQCAKIVSEFPDVAHFSAGDLLRAHVKSGTPEGNKVAEMMQQGQIVPSEVTVGLLQDAMKSSGKTKFLIDGFPRNAENRDAFEKVCGRDCDFIIFFDCPEEVMEKRLLGRNEGRADDNIETIRKRFRVFVESSIPVVEHYETKGKAYKFVATRTPEDIYNEVRRLFM